MMMLVSRDPYKAPTKSLAHTAMERKRLHQSNNHRINSAKI